MRRRWRRQERQQPFNLTGGESILPPGRSARLRGAQDARDRAANWNQLVQFSSRTEAAIKPIDEGYEEDPGELITALPCASAWKPQWAPMFKGKDVVLIPDDDDDGGKGMRKAATDLVRFAGSVNISKWKGATK